MDARAIRKQVLCGGACLLLGLSVAAGWAFQVRALVEVIPGSLLMVLNTALMFLGMGAALLAPCCTARAARFQRGVGVLVLGVAGLVLLEHVLDRDLGLDWVSLHETLPSTTRRPGRPAVNTCLAFALAGLVLLLEGAARPRVRALRRPLVLAVALIAGAGLVGHALELEQLYRWVRTSRMALPTALGLLAVAYGLWPAGADAGEARASFRLQEGPRILAAAAAVLALMVLVAGVLGFQAVPALMTESTRRQLALTARDRVDLLTTLLEESVSMTAVVATRPALVASLRTLAARPADEQAAARVQRVVDGFLGHGFSAIRVEAPGGALLRQVGQPVPASAFTTQLRAAHPMALVWEGQFVVRNRLEVRDEAGPVAFVTTERPLPRLAASLFGGGSELGETAEAGLCAPGTDARLRCHPFRAGGEPFLLDDHHQGDPRPALLALRGQTGTKRSRDYRGHDVMAAYAPVGDYGLGLVVKLDTREYLGPVRKRLQQALGVLVALVVVGLLVLRTQVRPLVQEMVHRARLIEEQGERLRQALAEAEEARRSADAASQAKTEFLARMSHDLRTPLTAILGHVQMLKRDPDLADKHRRRADTIHRSGQHLHQLVNDTLDLSKIEAGVLELRPEEVSLEALLGLPAELIGQAAEQKGLTFSYWVDPQLPGTLRVDERRLRQVLLNLLSNAVKFTPGGTVALSVERAPAPARPGSVRFQVRDSGAGIPPEELTHIFLPFRQGELGQRRTDGTGLGLAISQHLVGLMGGGLCVESELGHGSVFWFDLPGVACGAGAAAGALPAAVAQAPAAARALLTLPDPEALRELRELAGRGSVTGLEQAVLRLQAAGEHAAFAQEVRRRLEGFDFEGIAALALPCAQEGRA